MAWVESLCIESCSQRLCKRKSVARSLRRLWIGPGLEVSPLETRWDRRACVSTAVNTVVAVLNGGFIGPEW